jgi:hypothetical protein
MHERIPGSNHRCTIALAGRFLGIAKETKCLNETDWERLNEMRLELDGYRREGLTPKNIALIRQVLTPGVWGRVVNLPFAMMAEAQRQQHDPIRAAVTANSGSPSPSSPLRHGCLMCGLSSTVWERRRSLAIGNIGLHRLSEREKYVFSVEWIRHFVLHRTISFLVV